MNEIKIAEKNMIDEQGNPRTFLYYLLVEKVDNISISCENYGVFIQESNGDSARIPRITTSQTRIEGLITLLAENVVSPTTLQDVVEDWL